jgi:hypothetical protein
MATKTLGTVAATTLTALQYEQGGAGLAAADIATISLSILNDILIAGSSVGPTGSAYGGINGPYDAFSRIGLLYVPNRGVLRMLPGDFVGVDSLGWPVLVSGNSAGTGASGNWRHS